MTNTIANRIYLIGMMASGKSTIGRLLADRLGYDFVDMDSEIEAMSNLTISEIFEKHGEKHFRKLEQNLLSKLSSQQNLVISTGGGTPIFHKGIDLMNKAGVVIWLKVSRSEIHKRLSKETTRPLANKITLYGLSQLIHKRNPIYKMAKIKVWNKGNLDSVVDKILKKLLN